MLGADSSKLNKINWQFIGVVFCGLSVALGAFGAHGLSHILDAKDLDIFKTAVHYQFLHGLALILWSLQYGVGSKSLRSRPLTPLLFTIGNLLFAGSLYTLVATGVRRWGMVTPFGGMCYLVGWAWWGRALLRS